MGRNRRYDHEFKVQAIKLYRETGTKNTTMELGISANTLYGWVRAASEGRLDIGDDTIIQAHKKAKSDEIRSLHKRIQTLEKENRRLKEENEFLEEASAFFAASRRKSTKMRE